MLIHGRLTVTQNCFMLDEVRSLLQKALRRQETDLALRATKELIGPNKDQLPWKSIVTFIFEDHCLTHADLLLKLYRLYVQKDKLRSIELLLKLYTCRHSACLQVVAVGDRYRPNEALWKKNIPLVPELKDLVAQISGRSIDCDILLSLIVKGWQEKDVPALTSLFGLVNMADKVEKRNLTGAGIAFLLDSDVKRPSLHHVVLSALYKYSADDYMKRVSKVCFKFAAIADVPKGLIMFTALSQLIFKEKIMQKLQPEANDLGKVNWNEVQDLTVMPGWAVDKHTFRGKFGKASEHVFRKQIKHNPLSEANMREFHGKRQKADIITFFDVGCVCNNDILDENPIWEEAKAMYLKQKPSQQKSHKMTARYYNDMKKAKNVVFGNASDDSDSEMVEMTQKRKRKVEKGSDEIRGKRAKLAVKGDARDTAKWPLLQLPTGSGKVYTRIDEATNTVWKGPYRSQSRQNLCMFYHKAMRDVFGDKHTLAVEEKGTYLAFPLIKHEDAKAEITHRAFYDCIAKTEVSESDGKFVERSSLGIVQLHKLEARRVADLPLTVWGHFAFRYALNIGDTGLYNAIATRDLDSIFGIDMEERRKKIKGNDVMNMLFGKMPRREIAAVVLGVLRDKAEELSALVRQEFDFGRVDALCGLYEVESHGGRCRERLMGLAGLLERL